MTVGIEGKIVAITGASSGIGEATALRLARSGARVVLGARRADRLDDVVACIETAGGQALAVPTDVRRREDVQALVDRAVAEFGRLDVFVNNAGVARTGPLDNLLVDEWDRSVDVNFKALLWAIAATLPVFRRQESGHLVAVVSTAGLRIVPSQAIYAATKNAARTVLEGLRQEAGPHLRVTEVSPGFVHTDFVDSASDPAFVAAGRARRDEIAIPADAIARAIAFAINEPDDVDVNSIVVRPTAQD